MYPKFCSHCGNPLALPEEGAETITCPKCGSTFDLEGHPVGLIHGNVVLTQNIENVAPGSHITGIVIG